MKKYQTDRLNRLGFWRDYWFKSAYFNSGLTGELPVVICLSFCWWDVPDGFEQEVIDSTAPLAGTG